MAEDPTTIRRVDWYAGDFLAGLAGHGLKPEAWGTYIAIISICYAERRPSIPETEVVERLSRMMNANPRTIRACIERLIAARKLSRTDAELEPNRVRMELERSVKRIRDAIEAANERWKNKAIADATAFSPALPTIISQQPSTNSEESISRPSVARPSDPDLKLALDAWNVTAAKTGLPVAQRLTDPRARKLAARLAECGGIDGWKSALAKLEESAFLTGQKTDWRADFDFMLQAKSFTKLMEGAYDDQPSLANGNGHFNGRGPNHGGARSVVQIMADVARRMEKKGPHN